MPGCDWAIKFHNALRVKKKVLLLCTLCLLLGSFPDRLARSSTAPKPSFAICILQKGLAAVPPKKKRRSYRSINFMIIIVIIKGPRLLLCRLWIYLLLPRPTTCFRPFLREYLVLILWYSYHDRSLPQQDLSSNCCNALRSHSCKLP